MIAMGLTSWKPGLLVQQGKPALKKLLRSAPVQDPSISLCLCMQSTFERTSNDSDVLGASSVKRKAETPSPRLTAASPQVRGRMGLPGRHTALGRPHEQPPPNVSLTFPHTQPPSPPACHCRMQQKSAFWYTCLDKEWCSCCSDKF